VHQSWLMDMASGGSWRRIEALSARVACVEAVRQGAVACVLTEGDIWAVIWAALEVGTQGAHKRFRWVGSIPFATETCYEAPQEIQASLSPSGPTARKT